MNREEIQRHPAVEQKHHAHLLFRLGTTTSAKPTIEAIPNRYGWIDIVLVNGLGCEDLVIIPHYAGSRSKADALVSALAAHYGTTAKLAPIEPDEWCE